MAAAWRRKLDATAQDLHDLSDDRKPKPASSQPRVPAAPKPLEQCRTILIVDAAPVILISQYDPIDTSPHDEARGRPRAGVMNSVVDEIAHHLADQQGSCRDHAFGVAFETQLNPGI